MPRVKEEEYEEEEEDDDEKSTSDTSVHYKHLQTIEVNDINVIHSILKGSAAVSAQSTASGSAKHSFDSNSELRSSKSASPAPFGTRLSPSPVPFGKGQHYVKSSVSFPVLAPPKRGAPLELNFYGIGLSEGRRMTASMQLQAIHPMHTTAVVGSDVMDTDNEATAKVTAESGAISQEEEEEKLRRADSQLVYAFDDAIEYYGITRFQMWLSAAVGIVWMCAAVNYTLTATLLLYMNRIDNDYVGRLSALHKAMLGVSITVGELGALFVEYFSSKYGPKRVASIFFLLLCVCSWLAAYFAKVKGNGKSDLNRALYALSACRFAVGFCVGAVFPILDLYLEFIPERSQPLYGYMVMSFWDLGTIACVVLGMVSFKFLHLNVSGFLQLVAALSTVGFLVCVFMIPESPIFTIEQMEDTKQAESVLRQIEDCYLAEDPLNEVMKSSSKKTTTATAMTTQQSAASKKRLDSNMQVENESPSERRRQKMPGRLGFFDVDIQIDSTASKSTTRLRSHSVTDLFSTTNRFSTLITIAVILCIDAVFWGTALFQERYFDNIRNLGVMTVFLLLLATTCADVPATAILAFYVLKDTELKRNIEENGTEMDIGKNGADNNGENATDNGVDITKSADAKTVEDGDIGSNLDSKRDSTQSNISENGDSNCTKLVRFLGRKRMILLLSFSGCVAFGVLATTSKVSGLSKGSEVLVGVICLFLGRLVSNMGIDLCEMYVLEYFPLSLKAFFLAGVNTLSFATSSGSVLLTQMTNSFITSLVLSLLCLCGCIASYFLPSQKLNLIMGSMKTRNDLRQQSNDTLGAVVDVFTDANATTAVVANATVKSSESVAVCDEEKEKKGIKSIRLTADSGLTETVLTAAGGSPQKAARSGHAKDFDSLAMQLMIQYSFGDKDKGSGRSLLKRTRGSLMSETRVSKLLKTQGVDLGTLEKEAGGGEIQIIPNELDFISDSARVLAAVVDNEEEESSSNSSSQFDGMSDIPSSFCVPQKPSVVRLFVDE